MTNQRAPAGHLRRERDNSAGPYWALSPLFYFSSPLFCNNAAAQHLPPQTFRCPVRCVLLLRRAPPFAHLYFQRPIRCPTLLVSGVACSGDCPANSIVPLPHENITRARGVKRWRFGPEKCPPSVRKTRSLQQWPSHAKNTL